MISLQTVSSGQGGGHLTPLGKLLNDFTRMTHTSLPVFPQGQRKLKLKSVDNKMNFSVLVIFVWW